MSRRELGLQAENYVAEYLSLHGFKIIARNQKIQNVEIDLIVQKKDKLVLIEVKSQFFCGSGFEVLISDRQKMRILRTSEYLKKKYNCLNVLCYLVHLDRDKKTLQYYPLL
jgi:putative endonuclease